MKKYKWTEGEMDYLRKNYPHTSASDIAKKLHRTKKSIHQKALALNVKAETREVIAKPNSNSYRKGNRPWNLGVKGYMSGNKTSYKKGNKPHNTRSLGEIWIRADKDKDYKYIKTEKGVELLSHYIWKKHNGEIPAKHIIRFKDGDSMNCDIDNLMCISRAENARMNTNREKGAKTLRRNNAGGFFESVLKGIV